MERVVGDPFRKLLAFSVVVRVAGFDGLTISALMLSEVILPTKKMNSSSSYIAFLVTRRLPGRTDNEIKNHWNTHIKRKLVSRGIDPLTHRPVNEQAAINTIYTVSSTAVLREDGRQKNQELNLELQISPPSLHSHPPQVLQKRNRKVICFYCSLGIRNSKECTCEGSSHSRSIQHVSFCTWRKAFESEN
ncbi:hypothetical protein ES319_D11G191100v1 [Gossypium barbadense]|uniref:HTH myb-type domain-containing protein n=1 Tax=Gossypium barbadense TaxID=3634 RepID=A0A5J5PD23_GOSBA|nr:hypothetical protein ES319_D11G191100v1 [Gossypium barbadense]